MLEVDEKRIAVFGYFQGGGFVFVCAVLFFYILRVVFVYFFFCDYKRVWEMDLVKDVYEEIRIYFRFRDFLYEREEEIFIKLGYIDV